jgi:hypothetical protein
MAVQAVLRLAVLEVVSDQVLQEVLVPQAQHLLVQAAEVQEVGVVSVADLADLVL